MNYIEKRFQVQQSKHPHNSTLINYIEAIRGSQMKLVDIKKLLTKLVDRNDYAGTNREQLFNFLVDTSYDK